LKIKVAHITLRADIGGGPKYLDLLSKNINSNKIETYIFCPKDKPYWNKWKSSKKIKKVIEIPHRKFSIPHFLMIKKIIQNNKIDIIHSSGKGAGVYSRLLKIFIRKVKVVHTFHGIHIENYTFLSKCMYLYYEKIMKLFTNFFINVSKGEYNQCNNYKIISKNKTKVIYNAIEKSNPIKQTSTKVFRVVTVTRFDYQKNMFLAYEIAKRFKNNELIEFCWVGDGTDKPVLEELARKEKIYNINFLGSIKPDKVSEILSKSDIYLTTSRWEGLPFSLIEATASSLPILGTNVIGNNEVIINNYNGFLFEKDDVDKAIQYLNNLFSNASKLKEMKKNSLELFNDKFTLENMIKSHEKIYANLISDAKI
jgi:glycosyltransferase involved in cell wall biosynthesis